MKDNNWSISLLPISVRIENEVHDCPLYSDYITDVFYEACKSDNLFMYKTSLEKYVYSMQDPNICKFTLPQKFGLCIGEEPFVCDNGSSFNKW